MTRELITLPAEPDAVLIALRDALSGSGPAIMPRAADAPSSGAHQSGAPDPGAPQSGQPRPDAALPTEVPRRVALVVETSGSTDRPKRVALSADALLASAAASDAFLGGAGQWLLALPVHYIAGLNVLVRSIASQTEPAVVPAGPFDPAAFIEAAARMDSPLRFTSLVPAQLSRLLEVDAAVRVLRRFDRILVGGQSTPEPLLLRAQELGLSITRTYGASETSGGCVYDGIPIGNTHVRIVDGQVELSGSVLAEGYLDDAERTAGTFVSDHARRWYRTGDGGTLSDGVLRISGRLDDTIISGGLKVSLGAIEEAVRALPGQAGAVVVAAPSARWGEVPVIVTEHSLELGPLRDALAHSLGRAAAPDRVVVVDELPRLDSGKPDRRTITRLVLGQSSGQ
jgi:O-succinylbenzoic acid--CoA ligase